MNKDIEIKFLNDLTKTRDDYIDQENSMKKCLKISSYIRAISLLLIPVFTFWNFFKWRSGNYFNCNYIFYRVLY